MVDSVGRSAGSEETDHIDMSSEDGLDPQVVVTARKPSMWDDPVVRALGFSLAGLFILYLAAIVSSLYFGLIGNPAPRTFSEREVMAWESTVSTEEADVEQWQSYILALIGDGQFVRAEQLIAEVNANEAFDQTRGANMQYALAKLQAASGEVVVAIDTYQQAMTSMNDAYETELEEGGEFQNWAEAFGRHENYYLCALDRAALLRDEGRLAEAVETLDIYLEEHSRHAGVFVDRGRMKAELGDLAGAEADFREALRFGPDNPEALEGLELIGVGE